MLQLERTGQSIDSFFKPREMEVMRKQEFNKRSLILNKETIRALTGHELRKAAGGLQKTTDTIPPAKTESCGCDDTTIR